MSMADSAFITGVIAVLAGIMLVQVIGLLNPERQVVGTGMPGSEQFIEPRDVSSSMGVRSAVQTEPAQWHVEMQDGTKVIVHTEDSPFEELAQTENA